MLRIGAEKLGLWTNDTWGPALEDRGSQVTYSALGQGAPDDVKLAWDPDNSKKQSLRRFAAERLPDLEVKSGGSTSIDVTRRGIDKAYGATRLMLALRLTEREILFFGDRLDPDGNDYPIKAMGWIASRFMVGKTRLRRWREALGDRVSSGSLLRANSTVHQQSTHRSVHSQRDRANIQNDLGVAARRWRS